MVLRLHPACCFDPKLPASPCGRVTTGLPWNYDSGLVDSPEEVVVVHMLSHVRLFATPWTAVRQASLSFTISRSLFKLMSIESVMPSSHLVLCCSLCLLPSIFPSISIFSEELALLIRGPKCWSFSFSISPSNERLDFQHSGLIFFGIDWFDLLAFQETLKSLLQHHNLKAPILWHSAFFMVQLSHPYMTTGKTKKKNIALTRGNFGVK